MCSKSQKRGLGILVLTSHHFYWFCCFHPHCQAFPEFQARGERRKRKKKNFPHFLQAFLFPYSLDSLVVFCMMPRWDLCTMCKTQQESHPRAERLWIQLSSPALMLSFPVWRPQQMPPEFWGVNSGKWIKKKKDFSLWPGALYSFSFWARRKGSQTLQVSSYIQRKHKNLLRENTGEKN